MSTREDVIDFHGDGGLPINVPTGLTMVQRSGPMFEEFEEATVEVLRMQDILRQGERPPSHMVLACLKELMDVQFTIQSLCVAMGWDHEGAYRRVCASNLSKVSKGAEHSPDGKILKGPHYRAPYLGDCVPMAQLGTKYERMSTEDV